jgi:hypothetical protein
MRNTMQVDPEILELNETKRQLSRELTRVRMLSTASPMDREHLNSLIDSIKTALDTAEALA